MEIERPPDVPLLIAATIDCADLDTMTRFWGDLLDVEFQVVEHFGFLAHAPDRKVTLWLQRVPEEKTGKNRVHLDFVVADLDAALRRVESLGGTIGERQEWQGHIWNVCSDPEGNVFDIMQGQQP
ncbi:MAG: VOC family protein [Acidimicrobiia bacterium]|nr:VOC family protein [Acidimicrobiia bacterium]